MSWDDYKDIVLSQIAPDYENRQRQKKKAVLDMIPDLVQSNNLNAGEEQDLIESVQKTGKLPPMLATGETEKVQPAGPPGPTGMLPSPISEPKMIPTATMRTQPQMFMQDANGNLIPAPAGVSSKSQVIASKTPRQRQTLFVDPDRKTYAYNSETGQLEAYQGPILPGAEFRNLPHPAKGRGAGGEKETPEEKTQRGIRTKAVNDYLAAKAKGKATPEMLSQATEAAKALNLPMNFEEAENPDYGVLDRVNPWSKKPAKVMRETPGMGSKASSPFKSADDVKAAFKSGKIDQATALQIMRGQFGYQ